MKCLSRKLRGPVKWHGGKSYLARRIIEKFPDHSAYLEPFAGGLSVLLNKNPSTHETTCDVDDNLIDMWQTLRDDGETIRDILGSYEYKELEFLDAKNFIETKELDSVNFSVAYIVRNRMSRGGLGKDFAWSDRLRGGMPGDANAWQTFVNNDLPRIIDRIQGVSFGSLGACVHINSHRGFGGGQELIYADPPYMQSTRTAKKTYLHEMTNDDHHDLVSCLKRASERGAKVFLSGYDNALYREWIPKDWTRHTFDMPNHAGQGKEKQRREESLWESP